jgi:hypothetical protein
MYTAKVRIVPTQGDGSDSQGMAYSPFQNPSSTHCAFLRIFAGGDKPTICCWQRKRIATALGLSATLAWRENEFLQLQSSVPRCIAHFLARA